MAAPPVDLVRRAIERAMEVARSGEAARPPVPAPAALRPVMKFRRLPPKACATVAQVLDTDDEFRARVVAASDREDVGRVAWVWLERAEGWESELTLLLDELDVDLEEPEDERGRDKALLKKLEGSKRAVARAVERAERAEGELARTRQDLERTTASERALAALVADLQARVDALAEERRAAVAGMKRVEALLDKRTGEKRALTQRVASLEGQLAEAVAAGAPAAPAEPAPDAGAARALVEQLLRSAADLDGTARSLRALFDVGGGADERDAPPVREVRPASRTRRRPAAIPGGLVDDSDEVAAHLVTRPGAVLLVDGYNVSMSAWPELDIAEQRLRLERVLAELAARTPGLSIDVVFDGAEVLPLARTSPPRSRGVTVRFTAPDVEADDELLELVDRYPHDRLVIVASDDRRVRDGARRRGANVLRAAQLLNVARGQ
jgi:predicted RNA-binding protein with PIN domain